MARTRKYGHLLEYTWAGGMKELCRTVRPSIRNGSSEQLAEMTEKGWVLVRFLSGGTAGFCHRQQLRTVSNELT